MDGPVTLTDTFLADHSLGAPGVDSRWQPTRAGVVNSWAWADETLLFGDGWLALTGPNGSGKSLTASMLITVLLDADTSQTALSVSGKAAGTLVSRHTNRNDKEDRTGIWWLEYGLRNSQTGETKYLTTGLWLRAVSGNLQRAFFIVEGRVGEALILQRNRDPQRIEDLAAQLASVGGEIYTNSSALRPKAQAHLRAVGDERGYRDAVRVRLFAPLDEVQFEALIGVLRSLRSLRTAEAISPSRMRDVLTDALPSLDPDHLVIVAETMERIADLEEQLKQTNQEIQLLTKTDDLYRRYVTAIVQVEAAALTAANTEFDSRTREETEAKRQLEAAETAMAEAVREFDEVQELMSQWEGRRDAASTALRDHAGAELPLLVQLAEELGAKSAADAEHAEQNDTDAREAQQRASNSAEAKLTSARHLVALSDDLRATAVTVGAESAVERIIAAAGSSLGDPTAVADAEQLAATPLAWGESRTQQVRLVHEALRTHDLAQVAQQSAAEAMRQAEIHEDDRRRLALAATDRRQAVETSLFDQIDQWSAQAVLIGPVPDTLTALDDGERLNIDALARWLSSAADAARDRIDVIGHRRTTDRDTVRAEAARNHATEALASSDAAQRKADEAERAWDDARQLARIEAENAESKRAAATTERNSTVDAATDAVVTANRHLIAGLTRVQEMAVSWLDTVRRWHSGLEFLSASDVRLPATVDETDASGQIDLAELRLAVSRAHQEATARLLPLVTNAGHRYAKVQEEVEAIELALQESAKAPPVPAAPLWRSRRPEDGVPLWAAVDFVDDVSAEDANKLEGAMLVAGLLDALIRDDDQVVLGDVTITGIHPANGRTLFDLLRADPDAGIPAERIEQVLRAVPVDPSVSDVAKGRLAVGVLTASAPVGYQATFIGRSARERARERRLAELREQRADAEERLAAAQSEVQRRLDDVDRAGQERDAFPAAAALLSARAHVTDLRLKLVQVERHTTETINNADSLLRTVLDTLAEEAAARQLRLTEVRLATEEAARISSRERGKASAAADAAAETAEILLQSEERLAAAREDQAVADQERADFPDLTDLVRSQRAEDETEADLSRARSTVLASAERHAAEGTRVREALRELNRAASLPTGSLLPTDRTALNTYGDEVLQVSAHIRSWLHAATRTTELWQQALADAAQAAERAERAHLAHQQANDSRLAAARQAEHVAHVRLLYGADYERLQNKLNEINEHLTQTKTRATRLIGNRQDAAANAEGAKRTLEETAPRRASAEQHRDRCLAALGRLVDEGFAVVPDDIPSTPTGRPAHVTAGLTWARRLLADIPASADRLGTLDQAMTKALSLLERNVLAVSRELAAFDRQVTLFSIEGTTWRRAEIADPEAPRGQDLHAAVEDLRATAAGLEEDLSEDVKRTMKSSMFTQLRQDIMVRREAAQSLVRQISDTLGKVRTGVAKVGVKVEWDVRKEENAKRMVDLISKPPSDETHDQMYSVLRQRMRDKEGEPWADRVAHAFDYRAWHEWKIWVTHASFDKNESRFKEVTNRSNPMESLSTGERRLAIMLPLLAAAWSMYSGDKFRGPRLVSIDEIDAAFDEPNLRQILALLRSWNFDVLATAPFMTPMMKEESRRLMVHEVVGSDRDRITVPWLWEGHGEPRLLTLWSDGET